MMYIKGTVTAFLEIDPMSLVGGFPVSFSTRMLYDTSYSCPSRPQNRLLSYIPPNNPTTPSHAHHTYPPPVETPS